MLFRFNTFLSGLILVVAIFVQSTYSAENSDIFPDSSRTEHTIMLYPATSFLIDGIKLEYDYFHSKMYGEISLGLGYGKHIYSERSKHRVLLTDNFSTTTGLSSYIFSTSYRFSGSTPTGFYINGSLTFFMYERLTTAYTNWGYIPTNDTLSDPNDTLTIKEDRKWMKKIFTDLAVGYQAVYDDHYVMEISFSPIPISQAIRAGITKAEDNVSEFTVYTMMSLAIGYRF